MMRSREPSISARGRIVTRVHIVEFKSLGFHRLAGVASVIVLVVVLAVTSR